MLTFPALPGFYNFVFLHLEPISTAIPVILCITYPGTAWFYHGLVPSEALAPTSSAAMDPRAVTAVWQLVNCYLLLALMSSALLRVIRNVLSHDPIVQERILGAYLAVLAFADLTHIFVSFLTLPPTVRFDLARWNSVTYGNIVVTFGLFLTRMAWFAGVGRTRYYFGQQERGLHKKE